MSIEIMPTCPLRPRCRRYNCERARILGAELLERHRGENTGVEWAQEDFDAGEWEVALISVIESVDVPAVVLDDLEVMADRCFDGVDGPVAHRVVAKIRTGI